MEILLPGIIIAGMHFWIGSYPKPFPSSADKKREIIEVLLMWAFALVALMIFMSTLDPEDMQGVPSGSLMIANVAYLIAPFVLVPLAYVVYVQKWTLADLGFGKPRSWPMILFAVILFGVLAALSGIEEPLPWSLLGFAVYQPAFTEEFFFRVILQGKLERAIGQKWAWFYGGILFGLIHLPLDFFGPQFYAHGENFMASFITLLGQITAGWIFGIIYSKTRSILPGMFAHYITDGRLASIILHLTP